MDDVERMLQAVLDDPQVDSCRLVYADALRDRGMPGDSARADFIAAQVRLSQLVTPEQSDVLMTGGKIPGELPREHIGEITRLLRAMTRACGASPELMSWLTGLHGEGFRVRRGFPEECFCALGVWMRTGVKVVSAYPILRVNVTDRHPAVGSDRMFFFMTGRQGRGVGNLLPRRLLCLGKNMADVMVCFDTLETSRQWLSDTCLNWAGGERLKRKRLPCG